MILFRTLLLLAIFAPLFLLLSGCGNGNGDGDLDFSLRGSGAEGGVAYDVEFEGDIPDDLRTKLEETSQLESLKEDPPPSRAALRRRVDRDLGELGSVLRAEGYYGARIDADLDTEPEPAKVGIRVEPGPRYRITAYRIDYTDGSQAFAAEAREFGWTPGMPARGDDVLRIEQALLDHLRENGHPNPLLVDRKAVVNHDTSEMTVTLQVDPGPQATFGQLTIEGLKTVEEDYVRYVIAWPEGDPWDRRKLEEVRRKLADTNLFRVIHIEAAGPVGPDGRLPVSVRLGESKHRTIAAGINYSTDEQFGGELSWEHRNLFGRQERLRLSLEGSAVRQEAEAELRKPHIFMRDLTFTSNLTARAQQTDAYDERTGAAFVGLEKKLAEIWTVGGGVSGEYSLIKDDEENATYAIIGLPVNVSRDATDDLLNPTEGTRLSLSATPSFATIESDVNFTVFEAEASAYIGLGKEDRVVPALRVNAGSIVGADTFDIPITKRFFAGGGGSVRGYEYQKVGPLDPEGHPVGGRSLFETSLELRWRVTDSIGLVPFVDGGNVYDGPAPDFGEGLFWAAGLGFRYYTIAGPVRLDVAFPLNGREGIDDDFQIYISLGQAF